MADFGFNGARWQARASLGAGFVAFSRLEENEHFASDTVFGAGVGVLSASVRF